MGASVIELLDLSSPDQIAPHYLDDLRRPHPHRPWVTLGMISSLDGAVAVDGGSSALGGPPDLAAFRALRAVCDVVLVGAGTVRAEGYHRMGLPEDLVGWRRQRGLADLPRLVIVSRSLDLTLPESLLSTAPLIVTSATAPLDRRRRLPREVELIVAGDDTVDLSVALERLRERGVERITLEGGPSLNGQLAAGGLIDEMCVTIAPSLVGGESPRMVVGPPARRGLVPTRVIHCQGFLLLRYLVGSPLAG